MARNFASVADTYYFQFFSLRLVNDHCVAQQHREFDPVERNTTGNNFDFETYARSFENRMCFRYYYSL